MKYLAAFALALAVAQANPVKRSDPQGIDVSGYQPNIDWGTVKSDGVQFAYIKATEGTYYVSPTFNSQYIGATKANLIRGAYHFARPNRDSGAAQAMYFLVHGGGWSADGITLPGAIDLEANPYGPNPCYGLSASGMVAWIQDFSDTYHYHTSRYPVIYTSTSWWKSCTGDSASFGTNNPLWIASWASQIGPLPAGWSYTSFWQDADHGKDPGDADLWNGDPAGLERMARGS